MEEVEKVALYYGSSAQPLAALRAAARAGQCGPTDQPTAPPSRRPGQGKWAAPDSLETVPHYDSVNRRSSGPTPTVISRGPARAGEDRELAQGGCLGLGRQRPRFVETVGSEPTSGGGATWP